MSEPIEIVEASPIANAAILRVIGRLDARSAPVLERRGMVVKASGRHLILNLQGVTFIASSGLGALLALVEEFRKSGLQIRLASVSSPVQGVLTLLNVGAFHAMHATEESALQAMKE